jgi:hypothetical protein
MGRPLALAESEVCGFQKDGNQAPCLTLISDELQTLAVTAIIKTSLHPTARWCDLYQEFSRLTVLRKTLHTIDINIKETIDHARLLPNAA